MSGTETVILWNDWIFRHFVKWLVYCMVTTYTHAGLWGNKGDRWFWFCDYSFSSPQLAIGGQVLVARTTFQGCALQGFSLAFRTWSCHCESWDKWLCRVSSGIGAGIHVVFCILLFVWGTNMYFTFAVVISDLTLSLPSAAILAECAT